MEFTLCIGKKSQISSSYKADLFIYQPRQSKRQL